MNQKFIYDTTLRDGEQMPGVVFSKTEKIDLAQRLSDFGVGVIELMPAVSKKEREVTEYLSNCGLQSEITASTMMRKDHIDLAKSCGVQRITLFTSVSDIHLEKKLQISRRQNLEKAMQFVDYANGTGCYVDFAAEDATRADMAYLIDFINALDGKISYFLPCDTLGILTPTQTYEFVKKLKSETGAKIGLHIHNDFGQATANTLAGLSAGADIVSGTFTGIGERAGNTPLEEVVLALRYQYKKILPLEYQLLGNICDAVQKYSGVQLQRHKPISGNNAFAHESGTHVDGILKDPKTYENFNPEVIGCRREILFGKHSGTCGLRYLFGEKFSEDDYAKMLAEIKQLSESEKTAFSSDFVRDLFE